MEYRAKIVADSIGPNRSRLTTMEFDIWKPLLAEFNTHGLLGSRNFPSSRAIPWLKMLNKILTAPHIPKFRKNNPGMQPAAPLDYAQQKEAEILWLDARDEALKIVEQLGHKNGLNIHKQWLNRLLEPWITVTGLVTATEWDNFFSLRLELNGSGYPMAQDEFYFMALAMKKALDESTPKELQPGDLHIPYVDSSEHTHLGGDIISDHNLCMLSAGKCATVSYNNLGEGVDHEKDYKRATEQLLPNGHMSVFQHQAICLPEFAHEDRCYPTINRMSGQLCGWTQFRKTLKNEYCWESPRQGIELALDIPELLTV